MRSRSTRCRTQTELLKWARERKRYGGRTRRREGIGMGYTTHDKHIHPHYCNNPPATHQCSISPPPSPSLSIGRSLSFTDTHIHYRQYISNTTYQCPKILDFSFMRRPCYLISELQNKNHFSVQYGRSGAVPHQYLCLITNECFLWLPHCKLITYSCSVHGPWEKLMEALVGLRP